MTRPLPGVGLLPAMLALTGAVPGTETVNWYTHLCIGLNFLELPLRRYINRHLIYINCPPPLTG